MLQHVVFEAGKTRKKRKPIKFMFLMKDNDILGYVLARSKKHFEIYILTENGYVRQNTGSIGWNVHQMFTRKGVALEDVYAHFGVDSFGKFVSACRNSMFQ